MPIHLSSGAEGIASEREGGGAQRERCGERESDTDTDTDTDTKSDKMQKHVPQDHNKLATTVVSKMMPILVKKTMTAPNRNNDAPPVENAPPKMLMPIVTRESCVRRRRSLYFDSTKCVAK